MRSLSIGLALVVSATHASAILLDVTATNIGHQFSPSASSTVDFILGSFWGAVAAPSFTANLSSEASFSLTVSAPTGYDFVVNSAPANIGMILSFGSPLSIWTASGWDGGPRDLVATRVSFSGFSGPTWYNDTTGITVDEQGRALVVEGSLWSAGGPTLRFNSVTISADLSTLSGKNYTSAFFSPDLAVGISFQDVLPQGTRSDPGPAVALVASVPEPSDFAMFTMGGAFLAGLRFWRRKVTASAG